jgi:hypothetical protein
MTRPLSPAEEEHRLLIRRTLTAMRFGERSPVCGLTVERVQDDRWSAWGQGQCTCTPAAFPGMGLDAAADLIAKLRPDAPVHGPRAGQE